MLKTSYLQHPTIGGISSHSCVDVYVIFLFYKCLKSCQQRGQMLAGIHNLVETVALSPGVPMATVVANTVSRVIKRTGAFLTSDEL